jgi:predicted DNA-binding protein (MmcQ/YjbR family)
MSIESEVFKKSNIDFKKLIKYGFKKEKEEYIYKKRFLNDFEAIITINEKVNGKVIDLEMNEEYTNIRIENASGEFVNKVKEEYIKILEDIRDKCFNSKYFIYDQTNRITNYIINKYNDLPEFLWKNDNETGVFRNKKNNKWYGIIMNIDKSKLGDGKGNIEVINVKINNVNNYINKKGFYKAYHMNKENWITITLDETLKDEEIERVIDESYNIINEEEIWLVPANPKYYDVVSDFKKRKIIEWKQSSNIHVGDTVYLYLAEPYSAVIYKCKVIEVDIPYDYKDNNLTIKKLMKIEKEKEYDKEKITFKYLNKLGINAIRGPRKITKEISNMIDL